MNWCWSIATTFNVDLTTHHNLDALSLPSTASLYDSTIFAAATMMRRPATKIWHKVPSIRSYYSHHHPAPPGPFNSVESTILSAAMHHVPANGFTPEALSLGAKDAGYLDASTNLFPKGAYSLVHFYLHEQRLALAEHSSMLDTPDPDTGKPLGIGAKVKALTTLRLLANESIIQHWQQALA